MRSLMKNIPNTITCLNLFSGCLACIMATQGSFTGAFIFIVIAAVFDFLDGFAARLLKAYSDIGKELDSLADVVSFGVAPGLLVFTFLQEAVHHMNFGNSIPFLAFLIPVFSAVRLARFNIDTRQKSTFLGLPVPANALFWGALIPAIHPLFLESGENRIILFAGGITILIFLFSFLMVSELPMFSLKFQHYKWAGNELQYTLLILCLLFITFFKLSGVCLSICTYILLSVFGKRQIQKN